MDVFEAVAEPNRRALLDSLAQQERSAGELVATLPELSQPAVSRHLRVLREVGLVEVRADAQRRIYALRADGLIELDEWIGRYRRFWAGHLDALERHLAATHPDTRDDTAGGRPGSEARDERGGATTGTTAGAATGSTRDTTAVPQGKDGS